MSSIDWQRLVDDHDRAPERDDDAWIEALMAMDEDPAERELAEAADPLLMFRRLPEPEVTASDIDSMKAAVANMRQVSETLAESAPAPQRRRPERWILPLAAVLALAVTLVLLAGHGAAVDAPQAVATMASMTSAEASLTSADFVLDAVTIDGAALAASELPLVEDADPGSDLLMQIENDEMSLVVVLAPDQDV